MKRSTFFKIALSLTLAMFLTYTYGQVAPNATVTQVTTMTNYQEIIQTGNANESGTGLTNGAPDNYVSIVTVGGNFNLTEITAGVGDLQYVEHAATATSFLVPVITIPDPNINSGAWTYPTITPANLKSTWTWTEDATDATFTNVSDPNAAWLALSVAHVAGVYDQRYLNTGTTVETYHVNVAENSMNGAVILCSDASASVATVQAVSQPVADKDAGSAADVVNCIGSITGNTYNIVIALTGTPPFYIGYMHQVIEDPLGTPTSTYEYRWVYTAAAPGTSVDNGNVGDPAITGTLAGAGYAWTYTIPVAVDAGVPHNFDLSNNKVTDQLFKVKFVNDHVSRKCDRNGTITTPDASGERASHVIWTALNGAAGHQYLSIREYPTPVTGNIYVLHN